MCHGRRETDRRWRGGRNGGDGCDGGPRGNKPRGCGGGDFGGEGRCVTVVGKLTDGGEVDATVGTVAMVDRGETKPAGVGVETSAGRAGVDGGEVDATVVKVAVADRGEQDPRVRRLTAPSRDARGDGDP